MKCGQAWRCGARTGKNRLHCPLGAALDSRDAPGTNLDALTLASVLFGQHDASAFIASRGTTPKVLTRDQGVVASLYVSRQQADGPIAFHKRAYVLGAMGTAKPDSPRVIASTTLGIL